MAKAQTKAPRLLSCASRSTGTCAAYAVRTECMRRIDVYLEDDERRRKRGRKWLMPLIVGLGAALALGREKPVAPPPSKPVVVLPTVSNSPAVKPETTPAQSPPVPPPPAPQARIALAPAVL